MSTDKWPEGQFGQAEGRLSLSSLDSKKKVDIGYEYGNCPGRDVHLGLRFQGKPSTGLDGDEFPAHLWEQNSRFTLGDQSILLAGVRDLSRKGQIMLTEGANSEFSALHPVAWKDTLSRQMNVTAKWFVVHDTAGGVVPTSSDQIEYNDSGAHMFMDQERVYLNLDFSTTGGATKFEQIHPEFHGNCIHVELWNPDASNPRQDSPAPPGGYNYDALALAYLFASYRAQQWLTVTCHLEMDRGIVGGHSDPRGFSFATFYRKIVATLAPPPKPRKIFENMEPIKLLEWPSKTSTFGVLDTRLALRANKAEWRNTFPGQYGAVVTEPNFVPKRKRK